MRVECVTCWWRKQRQSNFNLCWFEMRIYVFLVLEFEQMRMANKFVILSHIYSQNCDDRVGVALSPPYNQASPLHVIFGQFSQYPRIRYRTVNHETTAFHAAPSFRVNIVCLATLNHAQRSSAFPTQRCG